jgi:hypothetical protein
VKSIVPHFESTSSFIVGERARLLAHVGLSIGDLVKRDGQFCIVYKHVFLAGVKSNDDMTLHSHDYVAKNENEVTDGHGRAACMGFKC